MAATAACGPGSAFAQPLEPDKLFEKLAPSIWVVSTFDAAEKRLGQGSAVVIAPGTLITNCHVLAKARGFIVRRDNVAFGATLEHADVERDLCQIQVKNFHAPAVEMAPTTELRVGQKVYALGNPRGLEVTFSDGMISALRRADDDRTVEMLQTTAPISPGSSGGGLFDAQGRLVGITTSQLRDSQNLNFAVPADQIKEVPARSRDALARRQASGSRASPASPFPSPSPSPVPAPAAPDRGIYFVGQTWSYLVTDRMTSRGQSVPLRVDRFDGDNLVFNNGVRVETPQGRVVRSEGRVLSELDALNSVGGWVHAGNASQRAWSVDVTPPGLYASRLVLSAVFVGDSRVKTPAGEFDAQMYRFTGTRYIPVNQNLRTAPYEATGWFVPALNRIVKLSARSVSPNEPIDEEVVLERYDR